MNANLSLRPNLEGEAPYGAPEINVPVRPNVNGNPYPPSVTIIESVATAVAQAVQELNRYPERDFPRLRAVLADYPEAKSGAHLAPKQIRAADNSNEVVLHVLQTFGSPGHTCLSLTPTYSVCPEYARDTLTDYVTRPHREDFTLGVDGAVNAIKELRPAVIILASPSNPTGTTLPLEDTRRILEAAHGHGPILGAEIGSPARVNDCVVVIDETYTKFRRPGVSSALELVRPGNPYLTVTRTMSKAFGAVGLCLGYLATDRTLVNVLRVVRLPYHLSAVTQATALAILSHRDGLMAQVTSLRDERDTFVDWLRIQDLSAHESDTNFALLGPFPDRGTVWQALLDAGVLIRVVGPGGFLYASIRTPGEMARLCTAPTSAIGK